MNREGKGDKGSHQRSQSSGLPASGGRGASPAVVKSEAVGSNPRPKAATLFGPGSGEPKPKKAAPRPADGQDRVEQAIANGDELWWCSGLNRESLAGRRMAGATSSSHSSSSRLSLGWTG